MSQPIAPRFGSAATRTSRGRPRTLGNRRRAVGTVAVEVGDEDQLEGDAGLGQIGVESLGERGECLIGPITQNDRRQRGNRATPPPPRRELDRPLPCGDVISAGEPNPRIDCPPPCPSASNVHCRRSRAGRTRSARRVARPRRRDVGATVLVLGWAGDRTFAIDEWDFLTQRGEWTVDNLFRPTNGHLRRLAAISSTRGSCRIRGGVPPAADPLHDRAAVPRRGMVYASLLRRLGSWVALLPALFILFYGAGWEVLINTAGDAEPDRDRGGLGDVAGARSRRPARRHRGMAPARGVAGLVLASDSPSPSAAAVRIVVERGSAAGASGGLRSSPLPVALYAVWFVWAPQVRPGDNVSAYSVGSMASGVFDQVNAGLAGITGLFRVTGAPSIGDALSIDVSRTSALVFLLAAAVALADRSRAALSPRPPGRPSGRSAPTWCSSPSACDELRSPTASRYAYMFTVLLLVAGAELLAGLRIARIWVYAAAAGLAVSLLANVAEIRTAGQFFEQESEYNRAELGALELARPVVAPAFVPESGDGFGVLPFKDLGFPARALLRSGRPVRFPGLHGPMRSSPRRRYARAAADRILVQAPSGSRSAAPGKPDPTAAAARAAGDSERRGPRRCRVLQRPPATRAARGTAAFESPPGGMRLRAATPLRSASPSDGSAPTRSDQPAAAPAAGTSASRPTNPPSPGDRLPADRDRAVLPARPSAGPLELRARRSAGRDGRGRAPRRPRARSRGPGSPGRSSRRG